MNILELSVTYIVEEPVVRGEPRAATDLEGTVCGLDGAH